MKDYHIEPLVAVVGRPNVGKSTLFNRLTRSRAALVHGQPGVTRDRKYGIVCTGGLRFRLVDTGGIDPDGEGSIGGHPQQRSRERERGMAELIRGQAEMAIREADLVMLVVDARSGVMPADLEIVQFLRRVSRPVLLVVNKVDGPGQDNLVADFYSLGFEAIALVSAEHARGIGKLLDTVEEVLPAAIEPEEGDEDEDQDDPVEASIDRVAPSEHPAGDGVEGDHTGSEGGQAAEEEDEEDEGGTVPLDRPVSVAIVGRPNVGKSTLLNRLLGEQRSLVSNIPGTTRDPVDSLLNTNGQDFLLIDTAGLRRKAKIREEVERWAGSMTFRSVERCDVCLLMVDGEQGPSDQDTRIATMVEQLGKGLMIIINKWDLVPDEERLPTRRRCREMLSFVGYAPVITISALTGRRVSRILQDARLVAEERRRRIGTSQLNQLLRKVEAAHHPPSFRGRPVKLLYAAQVAIEPPTIAVFSNHPEGIGPQYERYFISKLRQELPFLGTSVKVLWRKRSEGERRRLAGTSGRKKASRNRAGNRSGARRRRGR